MLMISKIMFEKANIFIHLLLCVGLMIFRFIRLVEDLASDGI